MSVGRLLDVAILVGSSGLGLWLAVLSPVALGDRLGLDKSEAQFERDFGTYESHMKNYIEGRREKYGTHYPHSPLTRMNRHDRVLSIKNYLARLDYRVVAFLAMSTLGVGAVHLRSQLSAPGPCGPGRVAVFVASGMLALALPNEYLLRLPNLSDAFSNNSMHLFWKDLAEMTSVAVFAAWLVLAGAGVWRKVPGWRERLGLLVGGAWIFMLIWLAVIEPLAQT